MYVPPELAKIAKGQRRLKLDERQTAEMIKTAAKKPHERIQVPILPLPLAYQWKVHYAGFIPERGTCETDMGCEKAAYQRYMLYQSFHAPS